MTTPLTDLRPLIQDALSANQWTTLQEIYEHVNANSSFDEGDMAPEATGASQAAWQRNVRNVLQKMKSDGAAIHEAPGRYRLPTRGDDWSRSEVTLVVQDYLDMLEAELVDHAYVKAEHNRRLRAKLNDRSKGSVEFKHQNISAILSDNGLPFIRGYKPRGNIQALLADVLFTELEDRTDLRRQIEKLADEPLADEEIVVKIGPLEDLFTDPPTFATEEKPRAPRRNVGRKIDYGRREAKNRQLGEQGEAFVLRVEQRRLENAGRSDLAARVQWTSKEEGDGLGYDIRSFDVDGNERLLEVKTTRQGKNHPFFITDAEVRASRELGPSYRLVRVYDFGTNPRIYELEGPVDEHGKLYPSEYRVRIDRAT